MFTLRRNFTRVLSGALLMASALADTVFLKSGEKIEGKVIKDTPQQLTVEVKISAGITDERVIARADVDRIEKVSPETEAYKAISTISPGPNSFAPAQYEPLIRALQTYVTQYPNSVRTIDVQAALNELLAEKKRVEGGEMKLRGQWLSKAEVEKEKVQLGAMIAFEHMKSQSAAGDGIGALNTFQVIEKSYPGAATIPDAIELARQLVASLQPALERAIPNQKALKAEKEKGFAEAGPEDRIEMMAAYKKEQEQAEAAVKAAETASLWPPFIAGSEKSLSALQSRITRESSRLAALPVDKMKKSVQLTNEAKQKLAVSDLDAAAAACKEATALWSANELAGRLTKEIATVQKAAEKTEKVEKAEKEAVLAPAPAPAVSAAPAAPAAPATPAPKPATPGSATPNPATPKPSASAKEAAPAPVAQKEEEAKPFYMTLPGAIGIVVGIAAILAGVNVFMKMRARKNQVE